jgi:hypothetical protein
MFGRFCQLVSAVVLVGGLLSGGPTLMNRWPFGGAECRLIALGLTEERQSEPLKTVRNAGDKPTANHWIGGDTHCVYHTVRYCGA